MVWKPDYVTLEEQKHYMRITDPEHSVDTRDDPELAAAITAASRAIDYHCNRQFGKTAGAEQRLYTPKVRGCEWVIDIDDLMTAAGLVVVITGVGTLTAYTLDPANAAQEGKPWTRLIVNADSTVKPRGKRNEAAITADPWGWAAVPVPVRQATFLQSSRFHTRRNSPYGVAGSPDQGSEMRLLARVDPDVGVSLRGLRRPRGNG